ncbi:MAG TPA: RagB/SusD family nutrient uptake outer membrane protein [Arachidicoccus sp.]|nr:RagB/SusD family nutrient uptake outer membrane protein [Arachidicoccus sp.]
MKNYSINKYYSGVLLIILLIAGSCTKDYLKPKPLSFYTPESTYNTADGLRGALIACERNLRYNWSGDGAPEITQLIFSDIAVDGTDDKSGPAQNMDLQITPDAINSDNDDPDHNRIYYFWHQGYFDIKYANTVVTYIDQPNWDTTDAAAMAERNDILGQAYFHRAFRYYELTNEFGDVPWIGKLYNEPKLDFQTVKREVILKKIKSDMEFAVQWVTDDKAKGEVTKGACQHLLAKIDLALGDFDGAIKQTSDLINGGAYHLMTERFGAVANDPSHNVVWDLHHNSNKDIAANKEALMLVIDKPDMDGNFAKGTQIMRQTMPYIGGAKINTPLGNKGVSDKVDIDFSFTAKYGRGLGRCRPSWYTEKLIWQNAGNDLRHAPGNWIEMEDILYNNPALKGKDPYYGKPLQKYSDAGVLLCADTLREWYGFPYYKLFIPDDINTPPRGGNGDWYVYRLAETYLVRAEAYFWKGDLVNAAADINAVRTRAKATPIAPADVDMAMILDERTRELYYEEERKVELTRIAYLYAKTGKAYHGKTYTMANFSTNNFWYDRVIEQNNYYRENKVTPHGDMYKISPYHVLWPVPQSAIDANTGKRINQNQGYSGFERNIAALDQIPVD